MRGSSSTTNTQMLAARIDQYAIQAFSANAEARGLLASTGRSVLPLKAVK